MRPTLNVHDERVLELLEAFGVPYVWAAGVPRDGLLSWPEGPKQRDGARGWDCSGFAQAALVRLNLLRPEAGDRGSAALAEDCETVGLDVARLGDLAFYGPAGRVEHVMVYLGGDCVIGSAGGGSATRGLDPRAFVQLRPIHYRADLVKLGRLR